MLFQISSWARDLQHLQKKKMARLDLLPDSKRRLFVGIDIGSTAFIVAYRMPGETWTRLVSTWAGYDGETDLNSGAVLPTALYYPPGKPVVWARFVLFEEQCDPDYESSRRVEIWKPATQPGNSFYKEISTVAHYLGFEVSQFAHDFKVCLLNGLFFDKPGAFFRNDIGTRFELKDIDLIFGKPTGWDEDSYRVFRIAAQSLGFRPR